MKEKVVTTMEMIVRPTWRLGPNNQNSPVFDFRLNRSFSPVSSCFFQILGCILLILPGTSIVKTSRVPIVKEHKPTNVKIEQIAIVSGQLQREVTALACFRS